jgi:hypothetical protein
VLPPLLRAHHVAIGGRGTTRDDEASAPCVGCRGITQPSSRITNTLVAGSGAGAGQVSHLPHRSSGASSSGISTTGAGSPAAGTGAGRTIGTVVAAAVAAVAAAVSCCNPVVTAVPRGGSPVITALPVTRGALDERRLVGTDASNLRALAGDQCHPANT